MNIRKIAAVVVMTVIGTWSADAASTNDGRSPAAGPQFTNFKDGDAVSNPVIVRFTSAGVTTMRHNMGPTVTTLGHLHLIIDAPLPAAGQMVPMDSRHIHLLHGETQATLHLLPGDHSLQLVLAGADHHVGNPPITSVKIIIHVVSATGAAK